MSETPSADPPLRRFPWRLLMLALGAGALIVLLMASDTRRVFATLADVRWAAVPFVLSHLLVTLAAAIAWLAILPKRMRPTWLEALRLRLIKEAINSLLPVAHVGGDVVRAKLAVTPRLTLSNAAASCILDALIGISALALFVAAGIATVGAAAPHPDLHTAALQIGAPLALIGALAFGLERLRSAGILDRIAERSGKAFGGLATLGADLAQIASRPAAMAAAVAWHLLSWCCGALETWTALWAVGAQASLKDAFILESLIQGVRALGFAVPAALGVQEGGYLVICAALGVPADKAVALSLLRRFRELVIGAAGLLLWRLDGRQGAELQTGQG